VVDLDLTDGTRNEVEVDVKTPKCIECGKQSVVHLYYDDLARWESGTMIQLVWPQASADDRELLKTGIHPECWEAIYKC
jgi:hypothetical protein